MSVVRALDQPFKQFRILTGADWDGRAVPSLDWIVDGLFQRGTVAMISGDPARGKTLILQQLLTAAALGKPWLGYNLKPTRTFGMFCEDSEIVLWRNQDAINRHYGCTMSQLSEDWGVAPRMDADNELFTFDRFTAEIKQTNVMTQLDSAVRDRGAQIVVLDTVADVFAGNEINRLQVRRFLSELRRFAVAIQGVVILTQHPSKSGQLDGRGESGSTGWNAHVRSRMYLTKDKASDDRILKTMKLNQGKDGGEIRLRWERGVYVKVEAAPVQQNLYYVDKDDSENCPF